MDDPEKRKVFAFTHFSNIQRLGSPDADHGSGPPETGSRTACRGRSQAGVLRIAVNGASEGETALLPGPIGRLPRRTAGEPEAAPLKERPRGGL
jgi:hypothetical protein